MIFPTPKVEDVKVTRIGGLMDSNARCFASQFRGGVMYIIFVKYNFTKCHDMFGRLQPMETDA